MASGTRRWPFVLLLALSFVPVHGVFTASRIFYVRDLSFFFWSRHLWLRHTLFSGQAPWWDPYVAGGQSAISDALNQLAMPIALVLRLLPSDVVSFNLWVALPLPIAAAGMFVFLRRYLGGAVCATADSAAALGASVFALSGPIVSMLNLPNLAWSVALMPWVIAAASTTSADAAPRLAPRASLLAIAFALQALCGEPVTWVATGVLAVALRPRLSTIGGLAAGALLASVQLVPTFAAGVRAHRAALATPDFWSLHPLSLWEGIAPQLFGNYYDAFLADLPWMGALNFGRDPFFYSLYVGPVVLLLAAIGVAGRGRGSLFWIGVFLTFIVAALGGYTPLYPLLRRLVPPLMYFRFPVKYVVFAVFALAALAAEGWTAIASGRRSGIPALAGVVAAVGAIASVYTLLMPGAANGVAYAVANAMHLKDPAAAAAFLARVAPLLAIRACVLLLAAAVLVTLAPRQRLVPVVLFAVVSGDLLITNGRLNLTMDAAKLTPPRWFTAAAGHQRLYIGGRVRGYMNPNDPDAVSTWQIPAESTAVEGRMELNALLPMAPSGWRVREALSYDLPYLWPAQYEATVRRFERATPAERDAFLRRSGVRWCVVPRVRFDSTKAASGYPGEAAWPVVADVDNWNMRVYDCHPDARRAYIATNIAVAADPSDAPWQREALFAPTQPDESVRLDAMPAPAGRPGEAAASTLRIVEDAANMVTLEATVARPSVVVLRDTYDSSWTATVDGEPATIARADGIYRAVAVPAGRHTVHFRYRPRDFEIGLTLSVATMAAAWFGRSRRRLHGAGSGSSRGTE